MAKTFSKQAWLVLFPTAILLGILLAYFFLPKLSALREDSQDTINYQIPVSDIPNIK